MLRSGIYPEGKVVMGSFLNYPRFCGPREAVFTAICRQNMGCSHFIIGRNHAGVGNYYSEKAYYKLFEKLSDIRIQPIFFGQVGYDMSKQTYAEYGGGKHLRSISGTAIRKAIIEKKRLPEWCIRMDIQKLLKNEIERRRPIFCS